MNVRVRGIYATALTALFEERVVQATPPIRKRFGAEFPLAPSDVRVETTDDRQGVTASGERAAVERARERLVDVSRDTLAWHDAAPLDAVFAGRVTETLGSGAVVDLGDSEGFLPYDATDDYLDADDRVRVQVRRPEPPWSDRWTELDGDVQVSGDLVRLVRGSRRSANAPQLTDLLSVEVPDGWRPAWGRDEEDASMDALGDALADATKRATLLDSATADPGEPPKRLAAPLATVHVWFGREGRFALDKRRRGVVNTMPGHHRVKASTEAASAGVDFAEALATFDADGEFPFGVATEQFGPHEGDRIAIEHGKPDGRLVTLGRGEVIALDAGGELRVERDMNPGGRYDALDVKRRAGDVATTKFVEGRWWYATVYRGEDGTRRGTYVNICTPVEVFPNAVRYVDLHVDVVKGPDGDVKRVDDDELDAAVAGGHVSEPLAERARAVASKIERAL